MGFLDRLFKQKIFQTDQLSQPDLKSIQPEDSHKKPFEHRKMELRLEGTRFPLFVEEAEFIEECKSSGLAALVLPFTEYWSAFGRGLHAKAVTGAVRLICSSCIIDMADTFRLSLPGGLGSLVSGMVAVGEQLPNNLPAAAKAAQCPYCGSKRGILVCDNPDHGEITELDMEALRELWRYRSQLWWDSHEQSEVPCGGYGCYSHIPRDEGYHLSFDMRCEECAKRATDSNALSELRKNPDYFGTSELRRARNYKFNGWRFERGGIFESEEPGTVHR